LLILDEIDQIEKSIKSTSDLYKIFEWPFLSKSKLTLIGIANSLDFTERMLPRLELKPDCKPIIINFTPYSKEDMIMIVKDRLKELQTENDNCVIIEDRAVSLNNLLSFYLISQ
jgi:cell division control protein 6